MDNVNGKNITELLIHKYKPFYNIVSTNDNEMSILYDDVINGVRLQQMQNISMTLAIIA